MNFVASKVEKEELEAKIASMRILENIDLPASIQAMLPPKPVKVTKATKGVTETASDDETAKSADEEVEVEEEAVAEAAANGDESAKSVDKEVEVEEEAVTEAVSDDKTAKSADKELEEEEEKEEVEVVPEKPASTVRMANLCVIAGHKVNGVAAIHSEIVKEEVFNDFYKVCVYLSK